MAAIRKNKRGIITDTSTVIIPACSDQPGEASLLWHKSLSFFTIITSDSESASGPRDESGHFPPAQREHCLIP